MLMLFQEHGVSSLYSKCIDISMQHHIRYLPEIVVSNKVINYEAESEYGRTRIFYGYHDRKETERTEEDFEVANAELANQSEFFQRIRTHRWSLFAANIGDHWVAVIMHVIPATTGNSNATIEHVVVADPARKGTVGTWVWNRLQRIFTPERKFSWAATCTAPQPLWYPKQNHDGFSCGFRTYDILRTMLLRINEQFLIGNENDGANRGFNQSLWDNLSRDMVPGKQILWQQRLSQPSNEIPSLS